MDYTFARAYTHKPDWIDCTEAIHHGVNCGDGNDDNRRGFDFVLQRCLATPSSRLCSARLSWLWWSPRSSFSGECENATAREFRGCASTSGSLILVGNSLGFILCGGFECVREMLFE